MFPNLRAEMARANWSHASLGNSIGKSAETAKKKLSGEIEFRRSEMKEIQSGLELATGTSLTLDYLFDTRGA
jgi:hypothetical protein